MPCSSGGSACGQAGIFARFWPSPMLRQIRKPLDGHADRALNPHLLPREDCIWTCPRRVIASCVSLHRQGKFRLGLP